MVFVDYIFIVTREIPVSVPGLFQLRACTQFTFNKLGSAHNRALKRYLIRLRTGANLILQRTRKLLVFLPKHGPIRPDFRKLLVFLPKHDPSPGLFGKTLNYDGDFSIKFMH